jgi:hypothetical protein
VRHKRTVVSDTEPMPETPIWDRGELTPLHDESDFPTPVDPMLDDNFVSPLFSAFSPILFQS